MSRRIVVAAAALAAGLAFPARAQETSVTMAPPGGTVSQTQVTVTVTWCGYPPPENNIDIGTREITANGVNVTSSFDLVWNPAACGFSGNVSDEQLFTSTGTITVDGSTGPVTVTASVWSSFSFNMWSAAETYTPQGPPPAQRGVDVTVDAAAVNALSGVPRQALFTIRNTGNVSDTYSYAVTCTGVVTGCSPTSGSVSLGPDLTQGVTVNYTPSGSAGATGLVRLKATSTADPAVKDSAWTDVTIIAPAPAGVVIVGASPGANGYYGRELCLTVAVADDAAMECGDLRLVHPLPSVRTLGRMRTPTLIYNSQHARPKPLIQADVTLPTSWPSLPTTITGCIKIGGVDRGCRSWPGSQWGSVGQTRRVVVAGDNGSWGTGLYAYTLEVTNSSGYAALAATGEFPVVNRQNSPFGAGWWLAGFEEFFSLADGLRVLIVGGDGSVRVYAPVGGNLWVAPNPTRPDTLDGNGPNYTRRAPNGVEVVFGWVNGAWRHIYTQDRLGYRTYFTYDGSSRLDSLKVPTRDGHIAYRFGYHTNWLHIVYSPHPTGGAPLWTVVRDNWTVIDSITDLNGNSVRFTYGTGPDQYRVTSGKDRRGNVTSFTYDGGSRLRQVSRPLGVTTTLLAGETRGLDTALTLDSAFAQIDGPRTDVSDVTRFWLNGYGAPTRIRNALGEETRIRYSSQWPGLADSVVTPNGLSTRAWFNNRGLVTQTTAYDPLGTGQHATTMYQWHTKWNMVTSVRSPGNVFDTLYYDFETGNRLFQQLGADQARRVWFGYQATSKLLDVIYAPGLPAESLSHNSLGNVDRHRSPMGFVSLTYQDAIGRDTLVATPTDSAQTPAYLARQRTVYDAMGRDTLSMTIGPAVPYVTLPSGSTAYTQPETLIVRQAFDAEGNLLSLSRQARPDSNLIGAQTTQWRYDALGRRVAEQAPDTFVDSTVYDPAGNAIRQLTRRGHQLELQYDALNRLERRVTPATSYPHVAASGPPTAHFPFYCPDGAGGLTVRNSGQCGLAIAADTATFTYDGSGNLVRADNRDARVRRGYYPNGALRAETLLTRTYTGADFTQHAYVLRYGYDLDGRRTWLRHPANLAPVIGGILRDSVAYRYHDTTGALASIRDIAGQEYRFVHDVLGQLDSLFSGPDFIAALEFDADGRLVRRLWYGHADTLRYDARGRVIGAHTNADTTALAYSGLGTLVWSHSHRYFTDHPERDPEEHFIQDALGNARSVYRRVHDQLIAPMPSWRLHAYEAGTGRLNLVQLADSNGSNPTEYVTFTYDSAGSTTRLFRDVLMPGFMDPTYVQERTFTYYGADQRPRVVDRRVVFDFDTTAGVDFNDLPAFQEYRYDALGRRVLLRTRGEWACTPGTSNAANCRQLIHRFVWDGDQLLYETSSPGATGTSAALLETDVGLPLKAQGADSTLFLTGRVAYTHGLELDAPLNLYRMEYSTTFATPVRLEPMRTWEGRYDLSRGVPCVLAPRLDSTFTDTTWVPVCADTQYPAPYQWQDRLARQRGFAGPNWMGSLIEGQRDLSGQIYHRNRHYDPVAGRFTQEDPIGLAGGMNVYGFANGDPVNFSDPFGLCPPCLAAAAMGAFLAGGIRMYNNIHAGRPAGEGVAVAMLAGGLTAGIGAAFEASTVAMSTGGARTSVGSAGAALETAPQARSAVGAARSEILGSWDAASFSDAGASVRYHYARHGTGQGALEYTREARAFFVANRELAVPHRIAGGRTGLKIRTDTHFGIYSQEGKIVSYGER